MVRAFTPPPPAKCSDGQPEHLMDPKTPPGRALKPNPNVRVVQHTPYLANMGGGYGAVSTRYIPL